MQDPCKPSAGGVTNEDLYEKWLRRRLDYACIRETGNHAAPGFVHVLVHSGKTHNDVASELRHAMWRECSYPEQKFFQHGQVLYHYPSLVKELLDIRFAHDRPEDPRQGRVHTMPWRTEGSYKLSFQELATVPNWISPIHVSSCVYPHTKEVPLAWTMGDSPMEGVKIYTRGQDPARINYPAYPACCKHKDRVCSSVYCREPMPQAVYNTGPMGKGDALIKWRLDCFRGK